MQDILQKERVDKGYTPLYNTRILFQNGKGAAVGTVVSLPLFIRGRRRK